MIQPTYIYRATCVRVIDGDSFVAKVDVGFGVEKGKPGIEVPLRIRLHGVDTPERGDDGWAGARDFLVGLIADGAPRLILQTYKDARSFERWVADVWLDTSGLSVAEAIIEAGHGESA